MDCPAQKSRIIYSAVYFFIWVLPGATPVHQQVETPPKDMWSHSVCNFSSALGVLNEDQLASFGESDFTEETFVLQGLSEAPKIADFVCEPQNNPVSMCLTSQTAPSMQICRWIFPTDCLVMERDLPPTCSGLQKTSEKTSAAPAQVWKQIQGFALAFEHSRALLQQVGSQGPPCSQDLNHTTCEMETTSSFYILFLNRRI